MKYKTLGIKELVTELERQKHHKVDVTLDSKNMRASVKDEMVHMEMDLKNLNSEDFVSVSNILNDKITEGQYMTLPPNEHAHSQLASKCKIPKAYYDRMLESGHNQLVADNVNAWLGTKERRTLRILDGEVRAVLSDKYKTIDNFDVMQICLDKLHEFKDTGIQIQSCNLSDTKMYMKAILSGIEGEPKVGDPYQQGLLITNSEVGAGSFRIEPFLWRLVCSNGMIGENSLMKIHLGKAREAVQLYSDTTKQLQDATLISEVQDIITATFDRTIFDDWMKRLTETTEVEIEKPTLAIDNFATRYDLTEGRRDSIMDYFSKAGDSSQYGLIQAVTRTAQDCEDYDNQIELERLGGKVSQLTPDEFNKVVA